MGVHGNCTERDAGISDSSPDSPDIDSCPRSHEVGTSIEDNGVENVAALPGLRATGIRIR